MPTGGSRRAAGTGGGAAAAGGREPTGEFVCGRILLSAWACLFGGVLVFARVTVGLVEPLSLGWASRFEEIVFLIIAGLPVIAWCAVFFRSP
jgi:hypothetical protein